ncbi:MAG: ATP-binding protein, partial [Verrucomicrobia bacterium]|nr:ATP-binding protein [Verrucomicrobiota bacterium]
DQRKLSTAAAMGYDDSLLHHLPLSLNHGIGAHLHRHGRILQASTPEALQSREITKEFQLLGATIAIPILDRQSLLGLLIFDERLTGNPFNHHDLTLIFHMLEEVGLAIQNAQIHRLLQKSHSIVADILNHLGNGCIVFDSHLSTLHSNSTAQQIFRNDSADPSPLEFSDLPQSIGSSVFTVIQSGVGIPPFKYQRPSPDEQSYRITIHPFLPSSPTLIPSANSALLVVENITEHERALRLEIESANLRLIKSMAEHLAHEIGNALVPLSTHQQLLEDSLQDPEFQTSLSTALAEGVKRISRLTSQMLFLARDWQTHFTEPVLVSDLLVEAFHQAHTFYSGKKLAQLSFNKDLAPWKIAGDHQALRHAFAEIMLNALQANPQDPAVAVRLTQSPTNHSLLQVEVRDSGLGFIHETAQRAPEPFFSTRVVGLGLGLTVSRKIIESHHGQIEIPAAEKDGCGVVRVSIPLLN